MLVEFDSYFISALEANDIDVEEVKKVASEQMEQNEFDGVQGLPVPDKMKDIFVTTNDISSREHGLMQRAFQEGVDSGISKTVNLPKEANHKDVHEAYMLAMAEEDQELGATIKGLTVYRDQSRETQVLTTQAASDIEVENAVEMLEDLGYDVEEPEDETPGGDN
jgi:ribonucleoside-diphosphate reductase alpha chain